MFLLCMLSWCVHGTFACKLSPLISYVHVGLDQVINIYVIMSLGTFVVHVLGIYRVNFNKMLDFLKNFLIQLAVP